MRTPAIFASLALLGCGRIGIDAQRGDADDDTGGDDGIPQPPTITVGVDFACTLRDGAVWCWGDDHRGQLGDNRTTPEARPVQVVGISDAISVVAGEGHACALRAAGSVSCWGRNESGQVGSSDRDDQLSPVAVAALGPATAVAAGGLHTCARLADATAWCWGNNEKGQLGFTGPSTPLPSQVLDDVMAIAAGEQHTCALRGDHTVWCWGFNVNGQLGDGPTSRDPRRCRCRT